MLALSAFICLYPISLSKDTLVYMCVSVCVSVCVCVCEIL